MALRYEAWTRQESGTFARKFPIKGVVEAAVTTDLFGRGSIELPMDFPRLDDILYIDQNDRTLDEASVIRCFNGETCIADFYAQSLELDWTDTGQRIAVVSGGGRGTALDKVRVRPFDYPVNPSIQPDWSWGLESLVGENGGIEDNADGILNPGAEDGTTVPWIPGIPNNVAPDALEPDAFWAINIPANADTGDWYFQVTAEYLKGVYQTIPVVGGEFDRTDENGDPIADIPGQTYTVTARIWAVAGEYVDMVVTNAKSVSTGTFYNGTGFAQILGNNAWQTATVVFEAESTGQSEIRFISASQIPGAITFRFDTVNVEGFGIGTGEWEAQGDITVFQSSSILFRTGTHSLAWYPASGVAGNDIVYYPVQTVPGVRFYAEVWVYHTEAGNRLMRLTATTPGIDANVSNVFTHQVSVPSVTWTKLSGSGVATSAVHDLEIRYDENTAPVSNLHADDLVVSVGLEPASVGEILRLLVEDAATNHSGVNRTALSWLDLTFTDTLDSNGVAWDEVLAVTIRRGSTYRQVLEDFERLGYEFTMTVDPTDDTVWQLNAYEPGTIIGTDHSIADGPAITSKSGVVSVGPFVRREPPATYGMAEGDNLHWAEYRNLPLETVWGEIEGYLGTQDISAGSLAAAATELVDGDSSESLVLTFQLPDPEPIIDYDVGDWIRITLADSFLRSRIYLVAAISVRDSEPAEQYQVEFQPVVEGT